MNEYRELQKQASKLGIKAVGVSAEDLKKAIAKAKGAPEKEVKDNPDAVVYNGKHKVRTYTFENHGKDYIKLAEQFVSHPDRDGLVVKLETVETRIACPHCGKKFRL